MCAGSNPAEGAACTPRESLDRVRLNLGSGGELDPAAVNLDRRPTRGVDVVGDARRLPIRTGALDEVVASSILEHFRTPYDVLDEIHRTLAPAGRCRVRVPCLGTHAAHADPTHVFLADLKTWRQILAGYFDDVKVASEGVKYRDHKLLVAVNHLLVKVFRFHELAQVWVFTANCPRANPQRAWLGWWMEDADEPPPAAGGGPANA